MKSVIGLLVLAIVAALAAGQKVNDPSITGYCGTVWHKWSGCEYRNSNPRYGINRTPIICFDQIAGFTTRSRHCVEGILCADKTCDGSSRTGDRDECVRAMLKECGSLRRTYTGNVQI